MLDTNVAIHVRDSDPAITRKVAALDDGAMKSVVRRARLDAMLQTLPIVPFDDAAADVYKGILKATGYSRHKVLDRMIAAQAVVNRATVVTMNAADFADIPNIKVLAW
jgi:predicted nucleic acid-binding protein